MDLGLKDKTALVCASSKGIGFSIALCLAKEGAKVFLCARNDDELKNAEHVIRESCGAQVASFACDLTDDAQRQELLKKARAAFGPIDILINNVGGPQPSPSHETGLDVWREGFERLFVSSAMMNQMLLPAMKERGFGRIINITSLSVIEPIENMAVSNAIRSAVSSNAKTLANEVARYGITVNNIMPGVIHTDRIDFLRKKTAERLGTSFEQEMEKTRKQVPAQRLGKPEELAALAVFLCSEQASYITGANIPVDGGLRRSWQ